MNSITRLFAGAALALASSAALAADLVETAAAADQFKTLVAALEKADLVDTLKGKGPYTVFAPTDAAFAKLPQGALEDLLKDQEKLSAVLTYHVVPGKVMSADVKPGKVKTVQGQALTVAMKNGGVMVNDARVIKTDVTASNGVIHVIDSVVLPN
jgi:uncharacterized surface protein with fasciclin (FAS1) repeats